MNFTVKDKKVNKYLWVPRTPSENIELTHFIGLASASQPPMELEAI